LKVVQRKSRRDRQTLGISGQKKTERGRGGKSRSKATSKRISYFQNQLKGGGTPMKFCEKRGKKWKGHSTAFTPLHKKKIRGGKKREKKAR